MADGIDDVVVVDDGIGLIAVDDTVCWTNALSCELIESPDGCTDADSDDVGIVNGILMNLISNSQFCFFLSTLYLDISRSN